MEGAGTGNCARGKESARRQSQDMGDGRWGRKSCLSSHARCPQPAVRPRRHNTQQTQPPSIPQLTVLSFPVCCHQPQTLPPGPGAWGLRSGIWDLTFGPRTWDERNEQKGRFTVHQASTFHHQVCTWHQAHAHTLTARYGVHRPRRNKSSRYPLIYITLFITDLPVSDDDDDDDDDALCPVPLGQQTVSTVPFCKLKRRNGHSGRVRCFFSFFFFFFFASKDGVNDEQKPACPWFMASH